MTAGVVELATSVKTLATTAPAKINLALDILGRRPDGFHDLRSLVIGVDLCDELRATVAEDAGCSLKCTDPALSGPDNLALRAAGLVARRAASAAGIRLDLRKRIPVAGGLGGGSSDAAAALRLVNALLSAGLAKEELARLGAELGSDVPLFFFLPAAVMTGRGEHVAPVQLAWSGWALLVCMGLRVSTREVYQAWRRSDGVCPGDDPTGAIIGCARADGINSLQRNELEPAVFRVCPAVGEFSDELNRLGLGAFRVSGAGSIFYRLYDDRQDAADAARLIEDRSADVRCVVAAAPIDVGKISYEEH